MEVTLNLIVETAFAIASLIVACSATFLTYKIIIIQRVHNEKSVKAIGYIELHISNDFLKISLHNQGTGPLEILKCTFIRNNEEHDSFFEVLPKEKGFDYRYLDSICDYTIRPGCELVLLSIKSIGNIDNSAIRKVLSEFTINIKYQDVYDNITTLEKPCKKFEVNCDIGPIISS